MPVPGRDKRGQEIPTNTRDTWDRVFQDNLAMTDTLQDTIENLAFPPEAINASKILDSRINKLGLYESPTDFEPLIGFLKQLERVEADASPLLMAIGRSASKERDLKIRHPLWKEDITLEIAKQRGALVTLSGKLADAYTVVAKALETTLNHIDLLTIDLIKSKNNITKLENALLMKRDIPPEVKKSLEQRQALSNTIPEIHKPLIPEIKQPASEEEISEDLDEMTEELDKMRRAKKTKEVEPEPTDEEPEDEDELEDIEEDKSVGPDLSAPATTRGKFKRLKER